jgi:L-asparaginase
MSEPRVHVLSTGGTIASTAGDDEEGAAPELTGEELVAAAPGIDEYADLTVEEVASSPGFDVSPALMNDVRRAAERAAADGADAVVVTHGTDTLASTAFYLDMTLDGVPAVVTGAQRRPDEVSADGPANLRFAARAATHPRVLAAAGGYVAFDEELHAGRDAVKTHTARLGTFRSPNAGPVAAFGRGGGRFYRDPGRRAERMPVVESDARVETVQSGTGVDGAQVERAVEAGADGLVVEGTGLGNATAALGEAIVDALDAGVPVLLTSRCHAGETAGVYGTPGGGRTLANAGAIHAGDLPTGKARLKFRLALAAVEDPLDARRYFRTGDSRADS